MKKQIFKNKGFTLIELMIVCMILGVLVAIAIPNFAQAVERSRIASVKANGHTLQTVVESYAIDHTHYPGSADELEAFELYKTFENPFTGLKGKAGQTGKGAWWTNDDGNASDAPTALLGACPDTVASKGLVIYVGLDANGDATTRFMSASGSAGGALPTLNYLIYACDRRGYSVKKFALSTGALTPAGQRLLQGS